MPIQIIEQKITKMQVDVIVNPTDSDLSGSGGVDRQIHKAAGRELDTECAALSPLATGDVQVTGGYKLPCRYVIHTVGPVWNGGGNNEELLLRSCYVNSLMLALKLGAGSVAFPLISSGTFGFPRDRVMRLALRAVSDFLYVNDCDLEVYICVVDRDSYEPGVGQELRRYLDAAKKHEESLEEHRVFSAKCLGSARAEPLMASECDALPNDLDEWLKKHDESFAVTLLKLIDKKGMTDVECYKKANVSRKTFYKINNDKDYRPSKQTVIAFAIALELDLAETERLLKTVGFSLSHSNTFDLIIEFCIKEGIYDVMEINEILYQYDQICLGC